MRRGDRVVRGGKFVKDSRLVRGRRKACQVGGQGLAIKVSSGLCSQGKSGGLGLTTSTARSTVSKGGAHNQLETVEGGEEVAMFSI